MQYQKPVMLQEQKLKMNPQLFQSIQLMALPLQELKFRIQEEIDRNPALEVIEDRSEVSLEEAEGKPAEEYEYFENSSDPGYASREEGERARDQKQKFLEGALAHPESLQEHLLWQLRLQPIPQDLFDIGFLLIQNLNSDGFHIEDPHSLIPPEKAESLSAVLKIIQRLDPVGVCVKDYMESLLVQLDADPEAPDDARTIISDYFELLEKGRHSEIVKKMKISPESMESLLKYIKTLNPFPGRNYSIEPARYVIPDLMVKLKEGEFFLILNDEEIPVLGINPFFTEIAEAKNKIQKREVKSFVNQNIKDARWFIRSIHQRNETLVKIARAIVEFQWDFFMKGPKYLVPLTLRDIAQEVSVHETTVSRISHGKYLQTEWGIFELKYFFSNSISGPGSSGSRYSKEGVKHIIKEILEEDPSGKHLSDQKIADLLKKRGIPLARRTVAKYRKELDIQSSYGR